MKASVKKDMWTWILGTFGVVYALYGFFVDLPKAGLAGIILLPMLLILPFFLFGIGRLFDKNGIKKERLTLIALGILFPPIILPMYQLVGNNYRMIMLIAFGYIIVRLFIGLKK